MFLNTSNYSSSWGTRSYSDSRYSDKLLRYSDNCKRTL